MLRTSFPLMRSVRRPRVLRAALLPWLAMLIAQALPPSAAQGGEPTNAKEASEKKADADRAVDEAFQKWKASLPLDQQAWETVLEENLGAFYLPLYKRDKVKGAETAWDYVKDEPGLPRVLLIGDSISRGYTLAVRKALSGKANVHRAPENCGPTANGIKKLDIWLGGGKWDVIHFNFGIHDRATPPAEYEKRLGEIIARLKKTGAQLIWASSTPLPPDSKYGDPAAIIARNEIAAGLATKRGIPINDLYSSIAPHLAECQNPNDCHFNSRGYDLLGGRVAEAIVPHLKRR